MARKRWGYDPQSGGKKIPDAIKPRFRQRILDHAGKHYAGKYNRIDIRFRGQFCYIDAYTEPYVPEDYDPQLFRESREEHRERLRNTPTHLCRLRYFGNEERICFAKIFYLPLTLPSPRSGRGNTDTYPIPGTVLADRPTPIPAAENARTDVRAIDRDRSDHVDCEKDREHSELHRESQARLRDRRDKAPGLPTCICRRSTRDRNRSGWQFQGRVSHTLLAGRVVYEALEDIDER